MIFKISFVIVICILLYFWGCFSTARILAKSFKNLNIYKVGTGLADITNIYYNVSKSLGIVTALLDISKMYVSILLLKYLVSFFELPFSSNDTMIFIFGFFLIAGHCMPLTHNFKGGRGIFIYVGLMLFFIPVYMFGILLLALIFFLFFKQFRFCQYLIVLLPPLLCLFLPDISRDLLIMMAITAFLMGLLNYMVSKRLGEF